MDFPASISSYKDFTLSDLLKEYHPKMKPKNLMEEITECAESLPPSLLPQITEIDQKRSQVLKILSNITSIFFKTLAFDVGDEYISLWDLNNVAKMYIKIFLIPFNVIAYLNSIFIDKKTVFIVAAVVHSVAFAMLYLYLKWIPRIERLPGSPENMISSIRLGEVIPGNGNEHEVEEIIKYINGEKLELLDCPILCGPTGCGKTSTAYDVALKINKPVMRINIVDMMGGYISFASKIKLMLEPIEDKKSDYVFFLDDVHAAVGEPEIFKSLNSLIGKYRIFLATTTEGMKKIRENGELLRRLKEIEIKPADDAKAARIISSFAYRNAEDILVDPDVYQEIIDQTKQISSQCQPALGLEVMKEAIAQVKAGRFSGTLVNEIAQKKEELETLKYQFSTSFSSETQTKICEVINEISMREKYLKEKIDLRDKLKTKVKKLFEERKKLNEVARELCAEKKNDSELLQKKYLWLRYKKIPELEADCLKIEKNILQKTEKLSFDTELSVPLRINKELIKPIADSLKKKYNPAKPIKKGRVADLTFSNKNFVDMLKGLINILINDLKEFSGAMDDEVTEQLRNTYLTIHS